jgi:paraquat-inducible protein B
MNETRTPTQPRSVAQPVIRQRKWPHNLIWIVPILTALGAGLYWRDYIANHGESIVVEFNDAAGLRAGETKVLYRGAEVGRVTSIELSDDRKKAEVHVQLDKREDVFATRGAVYWIVRPEVSESGLSGLGTLFSGPYIGALPGKENEEVVEDFLGLERAPRAYEPGETFVLSTPVMGHVQDGSNVYYKGIAVGTVQEIELAPEADHLDVHIVVWTRYEHLVRANSKFWISSGFDVQAGLFSGVHLRLDSLKEVTAGGVAFASPEKEMQAQAKRGTHFALASDPQKEWLTWSPKISVNARASDTEKKPVELPVRKMEKDKK